MTDPFEKQLKAVASEYAAAVERSQYNDASDVLSDVDVRDLQTRCLAAIERTAGRGSIYFERATAIGETSNNPYGHLAEQVGVGIPTMSSESEPTSMQAADRMDPSVQNVARE